MSTESTIRSRYPDAVISGEGAYAAIYLCSTPVRVVLFPSQLDATRAAQQRCPGGCPVRTHRVDWFNPNPPLRIPQADDDDREWEKRMGVKGL